MVALGEVLSRNESTVPIEPDQQYQEVTIRLWGKGVTSRGFVNGSSIAANRRFRVSSGQFIVSRIDARHGAMGIVPPNLHDAIVTNDFPSFNVLENRMNSGYFGWFSQTKKFVDLCRSASEGTTNRVRLKEERFLRLAIPLPPLDEQKRIVSRIDRLAGDISKANLLASECERQSNALLMSIFNRTVKSARLCQLGEVAPLQRRPAIVDLGESYPQVSVRSFGRGTFHNPPLHGNEITWQKPHLVKAGDILVSNIKAWEGAIAVAGESDDGRYGSHRYLTFVPVDNIATANFLCFYLLSPEGLFQVGEASPGSADRNRTLSTKKMLSILVPVPCYNLQLEFDARCEKIRSTSEFRTRATAERDALLPSILDRAFKGEL